jgi:hypothetical protein
MLGFLRHHNTAFGSINRGSTFQLTKDEFGNLKSQIETSSSDWGDHCKLPLVFTKHGALQAAQVY